MKCKNCKTEIIKVDYCPDCWKKDKEKLINNAIVQGNTVNNTVNWIVKMQSYKVRSINNISEKEVEEVVNKFRQQLIFDSVCSIILGEIVEQAGLKEQYVDLFENVLSEVVKKMEKYAEDRASK